MREDKEKLADLYAEYPALVDVYKKFIDTDLENGYDVEDVFAEPEHYSLQSIRHKMISYNTLLDNYRDTNFFDVFPVYKKYKET